MRKILAIALTVVMVTGIALGAEAEATKRAASIMEMEGSADVKPAEKDWTAAHVGMNLSEGDSIRTGDKSYVVLFLEGGEESANVEIKENTEMCLAELVEDKAVGTQNTLLDLAIGELLISSKKLRSEKSRFEVKTPTSIVGVRGTTFSVSVEREE